MSTVTDLESYQQFALQQQAQNNAWSAEQAAKQMDFQREMSNSAHQREVKDLQAAGLNPVLSANSGASVPTGAMPSADTSASGNVGQILQQVLSAQSAREVAGMYNAATIAAAQIAASASMYGVDENNKTRREYPDTTAGLASRVISGLQHDENGIYGSAKSLVSGLASGVSSLFARGKQTARGIRNWFIGHKSEYRGFNNWLASHNFTAGQLGYGSQQYMVALRLYNQGKYAALLRFIDGYRK